MKEAGIFANMPVVSKKTAVHEGLKQYFTGLPCNKGHIAPRNVRDSSCSICAADWATAYQRRRYFSNPGQTRSVRRDNRAANIVKRLLSEAKYRSKKNSIEFNLVPDDLVLSETCPCCNGEMRAKNEGDYQNGPLDCSPSIDRFDPNRGYVKGNVALICWRCNSLKKDATVDELRAIIRWMESHQATKPKIALVG